MLTHGAMRGCGLTSCVVCINEEKNYDIRERNVTTIRSEIWTTNIHSLRFKDIRKCVTLWRLILRILGCILTLWKARCLLNARRLECAKVLIGCLDTPPLSSGIDRPASGCGVHSNRNCVHWTLWKVPASPVRGFEYGANLPIHICLRLSRYFLHSLGLQARWRLQCRPVTLRPHHTLRLVLAVKLFGIMLRIRGRFITFHIITSGDADGWCEKWPVWSAPHALIAPNVPSSFSCEIARNYVEK